MLLDEVRLLCRILCHDLQQIEVHIVQTCGAELSFLAGELAQSSVATLGDGIGVELGAPGAGTDDQTALIQLFHRGGSLRGVHAHVVGDVSLIAVAQTDQLEDLTIKVVQLDLNPVVVIGHALPVLAAIVLGLAEEAADQSGDQGDQETGGGHVDVVADVEHMEHVVEQGEQAHGDHAGQRADEGAGVVKAGPNRTQHQQDGGRNQPAVGEGEQIGRAAGELAQDPGQDAQTDHDELGGLQRLLGGGVRLDEALIDVAAGHSGGAQRGGGSGGDGGRAGAHHEEAAQQGHEGTGQEAVGCRCGQLAAAVDKDIAEEGAAVQADDGEGNREDHSQQNCGQNEGLAGHLLAAAGGYLHPVVVVAPDQSRGKADDEVQPGGIGQGNHRRGLAADAHVHEVIAEPVGGDGVKTAIAVGQQRQHQGHCDNAEADLEEVGDGGSPQAGDEGEAQDHGEHDQGDHGGVPAGEAHDGGNAGDDIVSQNAAHADHAGDGDDRADLGGITHLQELRQGLCAVQTDKLAPQHAVEQQAANAVDQAPCQRALQTQLNGKARTQCNGGTGKADGDDTHHIDKGGNLASCEDVVRSLGHPALGIEAAADQDSDKNYEHNDKYCISHNSSSLLSFLFSKMPPDQEAITSPRPEWRSRGTNRHCRP